MFPRERAVEDKGRLWGGLGLFQGQQRVDGRINFEKKERKA